MTTMVNDVNPDTRFFPFDQLTIKSDASSSQTRECRLFPQTQVRIGSFIQIEMVIAFGAEEQRVIAEQDRE